MEKRRNGIILGISSVRDKNLSLPSKISEKIKEVIGGVFSYGFFIIEITEKDIPEILEIESFEKERFIHYLEDLDLRLAFYIKSKNHVVSTDKDSRSRAKKEISTVIKMSEELGGGRFDIPVICHIGGAKGNRKKSMGEFCKFFDTLPWQSQKKVCIINDDKPSLYSVKDLLSVTYLERKIPIVFRTNSYRTNQGGLTYKESLFLAASTWAERGNPILVYCPLSPEEMIDLEDLNPYNFVLDIVTDNRIPEPKEELEDINQNPEENEG